MKKLKHFFLWFISCSSMVNFIHGQEIDSLFNVSKLVLVSRVQQQPDQILLRWGLASAKAWQKTNQNGVSLSRITMVRDNELLSPPEVVHLGNFKPEPLDQWEAIIEENDMAAVMAQSLYGAQFNVEGIDALSAIVNLAEEQEQRFTWAMYAADQDFLVAQKAGLAFVDKTVRPNEKYLYKITSLVPVSDMDIEEGVVFLGLEDFEPLPPPRDFVVIPLDGKLLLSWDYDLLKTIYNSYFVERSLEGTTYTPLSDLPITMLNNAAESESKRMIYIDSIQNDITYYYRVQGITSFNEKGPFSKVASGTAKAVLGYVPQITTQTIMDDKTVHLEWEFLEEGNEFIKYFELNQSDQANGVYERVLTNIPPVARKVQFDRMLPTNYFTLTAVGKSGSQRTSFPVLVQPVDSVAPIKPSGLKGVIDSLGIVELQWNKNPEVDLLGYRVFRGYQNTEEFSQITVAPHRGERYFDSIAINNLNAKVYYQIVAVDQRFNSSEVSDILELIKPDNIPPAQPTFLGYRVHNNAVLLKWANSSSDDVVTHQIYRRTKDTEDWEMIYALNRLAKKQEWTDTAVIPNVDYAYTLVAIDQSGLESEPSPPLLVRLPKSSIKQKIDNLKSSVNRELGNIILSWNPYVDPAAEAILLYKGINGQPLSLFQSLSPQTSFIIDEKIKPNNSYDYLFRVVFKDGTQSEVLKHTIKY